MKSYMDRLRILKKSALSTVWIVFMALLAATWINTLRAREAAGHGHVDITFMCLLVMLLLVLFFIIAGLEIAYTDLRDKDPSQVVPEIRSLLTEMQLKEHMVYDAREWLGVVLIVIFTYISDFEEIFLPWEASPRRGLTLVFSLLFTSFPLVLVAQGPAKYFARRNSETFLRLTAPWAWPLLFKSVARLADELGLRWMSDLFAKAIAWLVGRRRGSGRRNLPPSNTAFYIASLKRYGYALHDLSETGTIHADGSATFTQRGVLHVVSGGRSNFTRYYTFDSEPLLEDCNIKVVRACRLAQPGERMDEICTHVESWQKGELPLGCEPIELQQFRRSVSRDPDDPKKVRFEISSAFEMPDGPRGRRALALEYQVCVKTKPHSFSMAPSSSEWHNRLFEFPCRRYDLSLKIEGDVFFGKPWLQVVFMDNPHPIERERVADRIEANGSSLRLSLDYPLPAANYKIIWEMWR